MHLLKATGSAFLHFKGRCTITRGGPPKFPPPRWHIRGSWQLFKRLSCKQKAALWGPPFLMLFSSCFCVLQVFLFLGFVWVWQTNAQHNCAFHKENLVLGKISIEVSWQLFKSVYCLWNSASSRWHTSEVLAAYWRWQHAMLPDDTGVPSYRGSL